MLEEVILVWVVCRYIFVMFSDLSVFVVCLEVVIICLEVVVDKIGGGVLEGKVLKFDVESM